MSRDGTESGLHTVDIHEAQARLSELVDEAANGEPFIIARDGKPLVKVVPLDAPAAPRRFGFLKGEFSIPDDFDRMCEEEIRAMFEDEPL